ncbi:hypothetical protein CFC21_056979 [Triticum aestivum]|uniref:NGN domain-containing protein n=2 Tax=Triticum aestivum TaxID=4565 RepID=A0A9R1GIS0_WHEAT|nr:uncharacterized protein LOC123091354 isoform X1 [Triticum aestivum]XP_044368784.1 uncharacterized protein LOC123091354 isoform X1 [Triticum aestivum]KAF7048171.1 hypothetical protein CFC21_056979 [Triticum aestivum]
MSRPKKQTALQGRSKSDSNIVPDTPRILDHNGRPSAGPDISNFANPVNFSVLNLDLKNLADLQQNMKDCIGSHRFWTYANTDKIYKSPHGSMSWQVPKSGTYFQYVKYRNNWMCLVGIASQSWLKGVITKKHVAEFQDSQSDDKKATYILTDRPKAVLKSKGNYMPGVEKTKLGPWWLRRSFDSVYNVVTDESGDHGDIDEAFTIFVVHLWDTVRNDEVKDLVLGSYDPSVLATNYLGTGPVGLMKKWQRCSTRAINSIEKNEPYQIQHDTSPTSASELLQVVRVLYRGDQDCTPVNDDSMPIKLNGVDELRHGDQEGEDPAPDRDMHASGSSSSTPKYPNWVLDSSSAFNEQQQQQHHDQGQISYAWASKMASTVAVEDVSYIRANDTSCSTGGFFTEERTENTDLKRTERLPPLPFFGHLKEVQLHSDELKEHIKHQCANHVKYTAYGGSSREFDGGFTIARSAKEPIAWRAKSLVGSHVAFCLMENFTDLQNTGTNVLILSALSLDHVREFILVEAKKPCDVAEAKSKRVTDGPAKWYPPQLQNTVAVALVESGKRLRLASSAMAVAVGELAGEAETWAVVTDTGRTEMRRWPFNQDGCSCWPEAADCDAKRKESTQGEEAFTAGGVEATMNHLVEMIRQEGKVDTANAVNSAVALNKSTMWGLLLAMRRLELDLVAMKTNMNLRFGHGESTEWIRSW